MGRFNPIVSLSLYPKPRCKADYRPGDKDAPQGDGARALSPLWGDGAVWGWEGQTGLCHTDTGVKGHWPPSIEAWLAT